MSFRAATNFRLMRLHVRAIDKVRRSTAGRGGGAEARSYAEGEVERRNSEQASSGDGEITDCSCGTSEQPGLGSGLVRRRQVPHFFLNACFTVEKEAASMHRGSQTYCRAIDKRGVSINREAKERFECTLLDRGSEPLALRNVPKNDLKYSKRKKNLTELRSKE
ncbi:hypothetical protein KM043_012524 [Ampulex compressa]|nr:hypothetical protein KM043_012524 [Ampulex compressa]